MTWNVDQRAIQQGVDRDWAKKQIDKWTPSQTVAIMKELMESDWYKAGQRRLIEAMFNHRAN